MSNSTRRHFLGAAAAACVAGFFPRRLDARDEKLTKISVLHTTDLHGHILPTSSYQGEPNLGGLARCATQLRIWQSENPHNVLIDVGDVFQGTDVGWRTGGRVMTRCFEALGYDGWVVGNHEFDWGIESFAGILENSSLPALSANALVEGKSVGAAAGGVSAFEKIRPFVMKKAGDFQIAVIGLTTPGLPYWFRPEFTKGFHAADPVEAAVVSARQARAGGADAIIFATHMGLRPAGDDFANQVEAVARAVPEAALIIAGHTHRDIPSRDVHGVLYTQAGYHGIHVGKTDLFFDPSTRRLVRAEASTRRMTSEIPLDPRILSLAQADLDESQAILDSQAGKIAELLSIHSEPAQPSEVERLIATAIIRALGQKSVEAEGVIHGLFLRENLLPGTKTIADIWKILPYENYVITGDLTPGQLIAALSEMPLSGSRRGPSLAGFRIQVDASSSKITDISHSDGRPLDPAARYRVAMNTYDAAGAGQRMMRLRAIMAEPDSKASIHMVQTRDALISFLADKGNTGVEKKDLIPL